MARVESGPNKTADWPKALAIGAVAVGLLLGVEEVFGS